MYLLISAAIYLCGLVTGLWIMYRALRPTVVYVSEGFAGTERDDYPRCRPGQ